MTKQTSSAVTETKVEGFIPSAMTEVLPIEGELEGVSKL